jgi:nitrogen fixation NifU-like protein
MVGPRLREVMLQSPGAGRLEGQDVAVGTAEHPVCGDRIEISLRLTTGCITELRWRANGCPAAMATAALAGQALVGTPLAEAASRLGAALAAHGGLAPHERHAEALLLRALAAAAAAGRA